MVTMSALDASVCDPVFDSVDSNWKTVGKRLERFDGNMKVDMVHILYLDSR
jgi:hypothetical protein